jgi:hypothetical protein
MPRFRRSQRVLPPAAVLALILSALLVQPVFSASYFFVDHFRSHRFNVHLQATDDAFIVGGGSVRRSSLEEPMSSNRQYVSTARSDYISQDWTYEITFRTPPDAPDDIIFIGIGEGVPDPLFFNEPRNSVNFRIHQGASGFSVPPWRVDIAAHDVGMFSFTYMSESIGILGGGAGGTFTARIRKVGQRIQFEILGTGIVLVVPNVLAAAPFLDENRSRLFFGNASGPYVFTALRVLPEQVSGN